MKKFVLVLLLLFSACSPKPQPLNFKDNSVPLNNTKTEIYIVNHGWHTGFVIPAKKIQKILPQLKNRFAASSHLEFGWGDRGFYQAEDITTGLVLLALLWPTESVMHTVSVAANVNNFFSTSEVLKLCINNKQYSSLIQFITNSFARNNNKGIIQLGKGIYGDSQFYQAEGQYTAFNTCNKWTANGLKSMGMDILPSSKLTAKSIVEFLKRHNNINKNNVEKSIACHSIENVI